MKKAKVYTSCECQGRLTALVDEQGSVSDGKASWGKQDEVNSPATAIGAGQDQFQIGWLCNLCHRNTLRSFDRAGLVFEDLQGPEKHNREAS